MVNCSFNDLQAQSLFNVWSGSITPTAIACSLNSGSTPREVAGAVNYVAIGY
ncbi:hypothetical protein [Pseudomonas aeruginosa]|uniref:hypothetical protein n=1 Tax=Pseudomonas aeruginosa TaxID=287 RepID=UPI0015C51E6E|nr:hypothetical protein [Pseudomonas aeruginosa]